MPRQKTSWYLILFSVLCCLRVGSCQAEEVQEEVIDDTNGEFYIESNVKAIAKYDQDQLVDHLINDGNQAFCSVPLKNYSGYLQSVNRSKVLNLEEATIPFLRNQSYKNERLNSVETYYGYKATEELNPETDLLTETSWLGTMLTRQVACGMKTSNLYYIKETCDGKKEAGCEALYRGPDGQEKIQGSQYTIKKLVNEVTSKIEDPVADRPLFCEELYRDLQNETPANKDLRLAIENFSFTLPTQYRTGYIVQATRICPVETQSVCSIPIYEHDYGGTNSGCDWSLVPDQIRIFPFKYPDIFSNKNFCNQYDPSYPENCIFSDQYTQSKPLNTEIFSYTTPLVEYNDPAFLNKRFLMTRNYQRSDRKKIQGERTEMATVAKNVPIDDENELINCINCDNDKLKTALVKIINATAKNNAFFSEYLKSNGGDIACGGGVTSEKSEIIIDKANNSQENALSDSISYNDECLYLPTLRTYQAQAQIKYWVVAPQGVELNSIETEILGTFYQAKTYKEFIAKDMRQNPRLLMNKVKTQDDEIVPITILGGGPVTNIFIAQESLYANREDLYLTLRDCEKIEDYFLGTCTSSSILSGNAPSEVIPPGGTGVPPTEAQKSIINSICEAFGAVAGADVASKMVAIARGESGLQANAVNWKNANGSIDAGLFQLNSNYHSTPTFQAPVSKDKYQEYVEYYTNSSTNIKMAVSDYQKAGFDPWKFPDGSLHLDETYNRGNYINNKNICIAKDGKVVYNQ